MSDDTLPKKPRQPNQDPTYEVGYGKPPATTRWKKGESGNRRGRPKGGVAAADVIARVLHEPVTIIQGGKQRRVPIVEATLRRLANDAARGSIGAQREILKLWKDTAHHNPDDPIRIIVEGGLPDDDR